MKELPTLERLKEVLDYCQKSGKFTWKVSHGKVLKGDEAGTVSSRGYRTICIDYRLYLAHRLAWKFVTGLDPVFQIDHKNGVKDANWFDNLREATQKQNSENREAYGASGFRGVYYIKARKKFQVQVQHNGKKTTYGYYHTAEEADAVAEAVRQEKFTHHREAA